MGARRGEAPALTRRAGHIREKALYMFDDNTAKVIVAVCAFATPVAQVAVIVARDWYDRRALDVGPRGQEKPRPSPKAERLSGRRRPPAVRRPRR